MRAIIIRGNRLLMMQRHKFGREYYTLIGGHVESGETPEQAIHREVSEETGLEIAQPRLVYIESANPPYGEQYVYLCEHDSTAIPEPVALAADADERKATVGGQNIYQPVWKPLSELPDLPFLSPSLKQHLIRDIAEGFPSEVRHFALTKEEI